MMSEAPNASWPVYRFNLIVTGHSELSLDQMFRSLCEDLGRHAAGTCVFRVVKRIPQHRPPLRRTAPPRIVGQAKAQPSRLFELLARPLMNIARCERDFVIILDDLEWDWHTRADQAFAHYRTIVDKVLHAPINVRAAVHFFVMMVEAYYLGDRTICESLPVGDLPDDVETIRNPKDKLKHAIPEFSERRHGAQFMSRLNLLAVLENPDTCRALRSLVKWCAVAMRLPIEDAYQLRGGELYPITSGQISALQAVLGGQHRPSV